MKYLEDRELNYSYLVSGDVGGTPVYNLDTLNCGYAYKGWSLEDFLKHQGRSSHNVPWWTALLYFQEAIK